MSSTFFKFLKKFLGQVSLPQIGLLDGLQHHEALAAQGQLIVSHDTDAQGVDALILAVQPQLLGVLLR